jgi:hypothetical protein
MTPRACAHEDAVVQIVLGGRWPEAASVELREHAGGCEVCRDVVAIVALLRSDFEVTRETLARRDYPLPSAGQIWWRAAVQARAEARRAATRPLVWGYGLAAACAVGLGVAGVGLVWPSVTAALDRVAVLSWMPPAAVSATDAVVAALRAELPIVLAVVACLVAAPVAIYVALRGE